ncbi:protein toll-like [Drosophila ananassae]|uniref:protein toll-like n=1 Tax=Drosophila ananassae TaxID=7217 RepID=UPI001CFFA431|nr:protein toll-like [Drosophila ananassae]
MANNSIVELPLQLIPKNILIMDLRNNLLSSLDDDVVEFLRNRKNVTLVHLSGNPWECNCKALSFLSFLLEHEPLEYERVLEFSNITTGKCPESCICCEEKSLPDPFVIDCSGRGLKDIPPLPLPNVGLTTLFFNDNELEMLPNISHPGIENVARLFLDNNKLNFIEQLPKKLTYLDLSHNNISILKEDIRNFLVERIRSSQMMVRLSGNPWSCTCEERDFLKFVKGHGRNIIDSAVMICEESGYPLLEVEESDICPSALIYYASFTASFMMIILGINLLVIFRQPILIWFYEHEICLSMAARQELDLGKKFDAFLSFTHKDENLVEEFVERLENRSHKFRLCFYLRDWLVGESIPECINRSVKDSRRIIILMTNNFLKSTWGRLEFRLALHASKQDRCKRLIVVLYPDVENFDDLDSELRAYMVLNTYLARDCPNFWNKLIYSMPHEKLRRQVLHTIQEQRL